MVANISHTTVVNYLFLNAARNHTNRTADDAREYTGHNRVNCEYITGIPTGISIDMSTISYTIPWDRIIKGG